MLETDQPGPAGQSASRPVADPWVLSSIRAWLHTFVEIDHEIFSTVSSDDSSRAVISYKYKRKYVH